MPVCLSDRNDVCVGFPFWPNDKYDTTLKSGETLQALLTVMYSIIFTRDHWVIEDGLCPNKVDTMFSYIRLSLGLIPRNHVMDVYTDCICVKWLCDG